MLSSLVMVPRNTCFRSTDAHSNRQRSITNIVTQSTTTIGLQIGLQMGERSLGEMGSPLARPLQGIPMAQPNPPLDQRTHLLLHAAMVPASQPRRLGEGMSPAR